ncbi:MAG: hypothetical protein NUV47_01360 [Patescibacteria group bacterium]|nr:hypothetical protein [Patescibacteria group bacterium]
MVSKPEPDYNLNISQSVESSKNNGLFVLLGGAVLGFVEPLIREAVAKSEKIAKRKTKVNPKNRRTR